MTRLIRWCHLGEQLAVLWWDDCAGRTQRTVVDVDSDIDGTTLQHVSGEPLPWDLASDVIGDLQCVEDTTGYAPQPTHYAGVLTSASVG